MEEFKISKEYFHDGNPEFFVKQRVMDYVKNDMKSWNKNLILKYKKLYKFAFIPVLMLFVSIWWYFVFNWNNSNSFDTQITDTQTAINELIAMNDYEIY